MKIKKKHISFLTSVLIVLFYLMFQNQVEKPIIISLTPIITIPTETPSVLSATPEADLATVVKIVDGDTIRLDTGQTLRYIGIDTPETKHPAKGVECYGKIAAEKNKELVEGKKVRLEKDVSETDRYGRLLRFVYLAEKTSSQEAGLFINDYLVREGYAKAVSFPPDIKYQELFLQAEKEAQLNQRGLWTNCPLLRE